MRIFNPNVWHDLLGKISPSGQYWGVLGVNGPFDALTVLLLREFVEPQMRRGTRSSADLFLLSVGEADIRSDTKIGGLPYWPRNRSWPTAASEPLPFLAQFDFQQSRDIIGTLPGDVLLVFAHVDFHAAARLEWATGSSHLELVDDSDVPVRNAIPAFAGTRWRVDNCPDAEGIDDIDIGNIYLPDGTCVLAADFLFGLIGMQIGEHPNRPVETPVKRPQDRLLCSLSSITPTLDCPYPFLNHPDRLDAAAAERFTMHIEACQDADDFRTLYISMSPDGTTHFSIFSLNSV